jgi:hypothetical protein
MWTHEKNGACYCNNLFKLNHLDYLQKEIHTPIYISVQGTSHALIRWLLQQYNLYHPPHPYCNTPATSGMTVVTLDSL